MNSTSFVRAAALLLIASLPIASLAGLPEDAETAYRSGDYATALRLSRDLASQGDAHGESILGLMYLNGRGVPRDDKEALEWLRKAAEQGRVNAQYNVGVLYATGRGTARNDVEAAKWYRKAADQGMALAQNSLGVMYRDGRGVSQDYGQAVELFRKAADQGNALGQSNLGNMYETGRGVAKDEAEAVKWYRKEAEQGNTRAQADLAGAATTDTFAVLSLVGDHVTIVGQGEETGSRLDKNQYEVAQLTDPILDDFGVHVVDTTIARARPDAAVVTLRSKDPTLYALRDSWLESDAIDVQALLSSIRNQLVSLPGAHLILITPYRGQPEMRAGQTYRGIGKVAGLGLYFGPWMRKRPQVLGAFANFQLVLIDLQSSSIDGHERATVGTLFTATQTDESARFVALSRQQVQVLESLMKREIERTLPRMLSSPNP